MKKIVSRIVVVLLVLASCASAQEPDASLWSGSTNPDGSQIVPVVSYDPATGAMTVNTLGMNQTLDSADCSNIAVDDAGMISLLVTGPTISLVSLAKLFGMLTTSMARLSCLESQPDVSSLCRVRFRFSPMTRGSQKPISVKLKWL
jgi:phage baseplate assembly protein gpV